MSFKMVITKCDKKCYKVRYNLLKSVRTSFCKVSQVLQRLRFIVMLDTAQLYD